MPVQVCWIHRHREPLDTIFMHDHHRQPRAFGGSDDPENLVWLCSGCHDLLHRLATMAMHGKRGYVEDVTDQYLAGNLSAQERFRTLLSEVIQAKQAFSDGLASEEDLVIMSLKVPRYVHTMLKTKSMDFKHPSGRPMGLYAYAVKILTSHVTEQLFESTKKVPLKSQDSSFFRFK